ncbi:hypothetical protein [Candidatus Sulfurimonas baltica]|uniref:Uncharacterized protein n=1 Tax=Candidatus Sulfurimonas baltica TaxID=2740404 RepID=A0A7S7LX71_9BACT|nr:hypothetical protein [Candidatus Sulfurimonas baltica]QOY53002.1 hypothetical protein HUE88_04780 [Candidatus Sulfurimonas baltica]
MSNNIDFIASRLPDLKDYSYLEDLAGVEFYYTAIYELFLRNKHNKKVIDEIINFYEVNKKNINQYLEERDIGDTLEFYVKSNALDGPKDGFGAYSQLSDMVKSYKGLPFKHYDDDHVYLNKNINSKIFDIINFVYEVTEITKIHRNESNVKLSDYIYIEHNSRNIVYVKEEGDLIYKEVISVANVDETSDLDNESWFILTHVKAEINYDKVKKYLAHNKHSISKHVSVSVNNSKYPVVNTVENNSITIGRDVLNEYNQGMAFSLLTQESFLVREITTKKIDKHKDYLRNMLKTNTKDAFMFEMYIYDAKIIYDKVIKKELKDNHLGIKDEFWITMSDKISGINYRTIQNNHTSVKAIIEDELYLFV